MQSLRQTNLFIAEDWKVVYKSFQQINFTSFDFDSIRSSMIDYIRLNYPEEFNDWIESSEFVALIDLIAYLGQSLAFRMDLNTRENFLDTAESRDSVLRLARMLSYQPQRNYPAFGLVKVVSVQTDEPVIDSEGRNLSGVGIDWNSASNIDWLEQFILIMNSAFNINNQFGSPVKSGTVSGIPTDLYTFNNLLAINVSYPFNVQVSGSRYGCEIVNPNFEDAGSIFERTPNPFESMNIIYRNDGAGNASPNTGFFLPFKQGQLQFEDLQFNIPTENKVVDLDATNVNQTDVWLQEVDPNGIIQSEWSKVPTVAPSSNVVYNALDRLERNIYTVLTRDEDRISLRFADGRFGNIPQGIYRVWYRTSNGLRYTIRPQDIQNFTMTLPYQNINGQTFNLTITYSLEQSVTNSTPRETISSIKERAPQVYYTQDRMVNGEDYNIFPLIRSGQAQKVKAVNRTYSGHSRYVNINDPTGTYQNTEVFADDGIFYKEFDINITEVSRTASFTFREIISTYILPAIQDAEMKNFVRSEGIVADNFNLEGSQRVFWRTSTQTSSGSTGYFEQNNIIRQIGQGQPNPHQYISEDALVNLVKSSDTTSKGIWIKISSVTDNGNGLNPNGTGKVIIDERLDDNIWIVKQVIPAFSVNFTDSETLDIEEQLELRNTFGIGYDYVTKSWYVIEAQDVAENESEYSLAFAKNKSGNNLDSSWLIRVEYTSSSWKFYARSLRYIWESVRDVRFFYSNNFRAINIENGKAIQDQIGILSTNADPVTKEAIGEHLNLAIDDAYRYADGYIEPRRIKVTPYDSDQDGTPDNPQIFERVVDEGNYLFWERYISPDGYEYLRPFTDVRFMRTTPPTLSDPVNKVDGDIAFVYDESDKSVGTFFRFNFDDNVWTDVSENYTFNPYGRKDLFFYWKHYASREDRIDPAITNIIDIFVLTTEYDNAVRNWIKTNGRIEEKPKEPTSDLLKQTFKDLESYKVSSDQIVWRPTKYKILFGDQATEDLKAKFQVVKVPGTTVSDNEIKSRIINVMDEFFNSNNWDFGETFYFTELAGYIHQRLATVVGSIVLVPLNDESAFGNLFQVKAEPDEIFLSSAKASDIQIVENLTPNSLRIGN